MKRYLTAISVLIASFAAAASTVQAFVSWNGRNDTFRSTIVAQIVLKCAESHTAAIEARWPTLQVARTLIAIEQGSAKVPEFDFDLPSRSGKTLKTVVEGVTALSLYAGMLSRSQGDQFQRALLPIMATAKEIHEKKPLSAEWAVRMTEHADTLADELVKQCTTILDHVR